jgi:hypothetical protein
VEVPVHHDAIFTTVSRQAGAKTKNWDSIKFAW